MCGKMPSLPFTRNYITNTEILNHDDANLSKMTLTGSVSLMYMYIYACNMYTHIKYMHQ